MTEGKNMLISRKDFLKKVSFGLLAGVSTACNLTWQSSPMQPTLQPFATSANVLMKPTPSPTTTPQATPTFSPDKLQKVLSDEEVIFLAQHEIREGDTSRPVMMMTYDDNAKYKQVRTILDAYKKHNAKATFFFLGEMLIPSSKSVHAIVEEGHLLGCHGWSHTNFRELNDDQINRAYEKCFASMHEVVPGYQMRFVRFPYGEGIGMERLLCLSAQWGLQHVFWTTGSGGLDSKTYANVMRNAGNGVIILAHMFRPFDVSHAERIVDNLIEEGYLLETVETGRKPSDVYQPMPNPKL